MCNCQGNSSAPREVWTSAQAEAEHRKMLADQAAQNAQSAANATANSRS